MGLSLREELSVFIYAVGLGMWFGVAYEVLMAVRFFLRQYRWRAAMLDVAYFFLCGVAAYLFLLVMLDGSLRWYPFFGFFVGWAAFFGTVGRWTLGWLCRFFRWIARWSRRVWVKIWGAGRRRVEFLKKVRKK